jgi:hypothetical protein
VTLRPLFQTGKIRISEHCTIEISNLESGNEKEKKQKKQKKERKGLAFFAALCNNNACAASG